MKFIARLLIFVSSLEKARMEGKERENYGA